MRLGDAPSRLGRYVIIRRLGAGGMAEVFLARSRGAEGTDKLVVVKRILPAFATNAKFRSMFVDEARVALRLNHPNIVQFYGFESDGPSLLLVMEHVDGPDLMAFTQAVYSRGDRVPPGLAAWITREVARGLHYAHERRDDDGTSLEIVHRDVSPGNVMLSREGTVKLGDFGIARASHVASEEDPGAIKGKFAYMSPEQARTESVDRRADLYSLGIVLGELLAAKQLFSTVRSSADLLPLLRRGETPNIHTVAPQAPELLRNIVAKLTNADRNERFSTAKDVAAALTKYLRSCDQEWDASSLEQHISKYCVPSTDTVINAPRVQHDAKTVAHLRVAKSSKNPPVHTIAEEVPEHARSVVIEDRSSKEEIPLPPKLPEVGNYGEFSLESTSQPHQDHSPESHSSRPSALEGVGLMRERIHVAVVVGRVVAPSHNEATVDTRPTWTLIESLAFKYNATMDRSEEDRFTIIVGLFTPHVDHALHAARLALDLSEAASILATEPEPLHSIGGLPSTSVSGTSGTSLEPQETAGVALGLARGIAAVARGNSGSILGFELVDEALPFAKSLSEFASAGECLVTAGLYRLVRRAFVLEPHNNNAGITAKAWKLRRPKTRSEREEEIRAAHLALVGRDTELQKLRETFQRVREQAQGEGLFVVGELGSGKSALLASFAAEFETDAKAMRIPVAFGSATRSYSCIAQLLMDLLGVSEERDRTELNLPMLAERAADVAGVAGAQRAARRALRVALGLEPDETGLEGATSRELALVLRKLLSARATISELALIVDGIESADRESRSILLDLVRKPVTAPVLLILGVRDTDSILTEGTSVPTLFVPPLSNEARRALIAWRLGAQDIGPELVREVSSVAGGNPLMLLEVVEALTDRGRVEVHVDEQGSRVTLSRERDGALPLPATLEEVLAARIDALPPESRALARWSALVDAELPSELLENLAGENAQRAIGRLVADGILIRSRGRKDVLTFAHAALAKVARASIDPTQLPGMHAHIAAILERQPTSKGEGALMLARHREAAGAIRPSARAYLERASACRTASKHREALEAYAKVLALTMETTDPEGYSLRFAAHTGREEIARTTGLTRAQRAEIIAMRQVAVIARDPKLIARALARQARYKLETSLGSGVERDVEAATKAARKAGELRAEAEAKRVLAVYLGQRGRYTEALHAADEALAALETRSALLPPPGGSAEDGIRAARTARIEVLIAKGALLRQTGEPTRAIEVYAEVYALLTRYGPRKLLAHVLNSLGVACYAQGDTADALRLYLAAIAVHREVGQRDRLGMALSNAGQAYADLGDTERALTFLRKAIEVFAVLGSHAVGAADAHTALAELHAQRGEIDLALGHLERAKVAAETSDSRYDLVRVRLGETVVALARGDFRLARSSAEQADQLSTEAGIIVYSLHARAYASVAAAYAGDLESAKKFVDDLLGSSHLNPPLRIERAEILASACALTLELLGEHQRAAELRRYCRGPTTSIAIGGPPQLPE